MNRPREKGGITRTLRQLGPRVREQALARIAQWAPEEEGAFREKSLSDAEKKAKKEQEITDQWKASLAHRQSTMAPPTGEAKKQFRKEILNDQRSALNNFFPGSPRQPRASAEEAVTIPDNGTGLPQAASEAGRGLQTYCEKQSFGMCRHCCAIGLRRLYQSDMKKGKEFLPEIAKSQCSFCKGKHKFYVPQPKEVPAPLRGLTPAVVKSLRPLDINVGPVTMAPNGYRKRVRPMTFSWCLQRVKEKIRQLPTEAEREKAKAARAYLRSGEENSWYWQFEERHKQFFDRNRHESEENQKEAAKRPLQFIEEPCLEMVLWPQLYWKQDMCESDERLNTQRMRTLAGEEAPSSDEEGEETERRRSMKRSFAAKLLAPLLGYGDDFELVQYVFDLHLSTDLGAKKGQAAKRTGIPMRMMMKRHPMSPLYWKEDLYGLQDMVKQRGYPQVYFTLAPYEKSYPYNDILRNEMEKLLRARMNLPALETVHMTHTMIQICRGFLAGQTSKKGMGWERSWLGGEDNGVRFFLRLEYQDGSKKQGTQKYHGSGRPHIHALFWIDDVVKAKLHAAISATMPDEEVLAGYVAGSQRDRGGESMWPEDLGESRTDPETGAVHLHHTAEDAENGLRGYFPPVMDALRCHQDVQMTDGRNLVLQYVAKYVAKWSDSSYEEWFSDTASTTSLQRKVLFEYHPFYPEMVLQLMGNYVKQWDIGTESEGMRRLRVPKPDEQQQPEEVETYMKSSWREEGMSLADFLRKSTRKGEPAPWLRQLHKKMSKKRPREEDAGEEATRFHRFANQYKLRGEQVLAADYLWRLNDDYYGQWLMMHYPFRSLDAFDVPQVVETVV